MYKKLLLFLTCGWLSLSADHVIQFTDVPAVEFIRFVSKISGKNFVYNGKDLDFSVSLSSGGPLSDEAVVQALVQILQSHGLKVSSSEGYYVVHSAESNFPIEEAPVPPGSYDFSIYKLQYHEGPEIENSLKKIAADLQAQPEAPVKLIQAISSLQWVKATNSLLLSADPETLKKLTKLISSLDVPLRQVFIEVLVVETDAKNSMEFGLQWASSAKINGRAGFSAGPQGAFSSAVSQGVSALDQIPSLPGFDLGVIGDVITHRGRSYFSLGSLVSALQVDRESTIVLNQKMITQDNKNSTIFVGDNIPFTGSVVQTVGQSQQTTSNVEYRDIGVRLSLTPRLGEGDVITLQLDEEISEAFDGDLMRGSQNSGGIRTTKTNMATNVHVPDKHFLVLSGMIRNSKTHQKAGLPCLGGLPGLGHLFSKTEERDEKRNIVIFVRPHIVRTSGEYKALSETQEEQFRSQANQSDFDRALDLVRE